MWTCFHVVLGATIILLFRGLRILLDLRMYVEILGCVPRSLTQKR